MITRPKTTVQTADVTVADANSIENTDLNMYIIIGVAGGILLVVGIAVLTFFLIKKKSEAKNVKKIDVKTIIGVQNIVVSETELDAQYHPQDGFSDINIFSSNNNIKKENQEELTGQSDTISQFNSNYKLHNNTVGVQLAEAKELKINSKKPNLDASA